MHCLAKYSAAFGAWWLLPFVAQAASNSSGYGTATFHHTPSNFTFTIRHVQQTGDVLFRLACPAGFTWVAVGFGDRMANSLMFVVYPGKDNNLVLSPRVARGHVEPSHLPRVALNSVEPPDDPPSGVHNGVWSVAAVCPNCTESLGIGSGIDKPDFSNPLEEMIFAFGPPGETSDESLNAPLRRHAEYGHFNIDLSAATTSESTIPRLGTSMDHAHMEGPTVKDHEILPTLHAVCMCLAFAAIFPSGIVAALFRKLKLHVWVQIAGFIVVLAGLATGLVSGKYYNRSKRLDSGHQIFGLVVFGLLVAQLTTALFGLATRMRVHPVLGCLLVGAGVINGAFGFRFALTSFEKIYVPLVIAVALVLGVLVGVALFRRSSVAGSGYAKPEVEDRTGDVVPSKGLVSQPYGHREWDKSDVALQSLQPQEPKEML